ncbi:MAG: MATE family efflux transporter [Paludibacteraceae bacterium]|nr:MATE family efflux transporter [Paludibacteraceae bacterium]
MNTNREILRLAVPSILANITIPLVGIVDTAIVGHISDASAIGGIAVGTMLFDLLYWNFGFLRIGTSGLTAQAYGSNNRSECFNLLRQSVLIALVAAAAIWLIQWVFVSLVLMLVPCSEHVADIAREYFYIRIWAAPATLTLMAFKGWFIGMQDTRSPMAVDILVNVVNMAASYLLAVNAGLGVAGVAWGTLIAQYSGLLSAVVFFWVKYHSPATVRPFARSYLASARTIIAPLRHYNWRGYFRFNGNLFVRSLCFMVVYVGFTSLAGGFGDTELAVSSIIMKLFLFFSYFVDGFAYAGEALVGRAFGEIKTADPPAKATDIHAIVRLLFYWSMGVGVVFTLLYGVWGDNCIALLTGDAEVIRESGKYMGWLAAMPVISTLAFMWDGVYTGAVAGEQIRNAMIWAAVAFVVLYMATNRWVGPQALYIAYFAHLAARVLYLTINWKKTYELSQIR